MRRVVIIREVLRHRPTLYPKGPTRALIGCDCGWYAVGKQTSKASAEGSALALYRSHMASGETAPTRDLESATPNPSSERGG